MDAAKNAVDKGVKSRSAFGEGDRKYGAPKGGSHPGSVIRRCRQVPGGSSQRLDNNLTPEVYHTPQSPQVGRSGRQHPHATSAHDDAVPACETTLSLVSISRYLGQMVIMDWGGSLRPQRC